jgi:hypothetical protein
MAAITRLLPSTVIHYRAVVQSDFATLKGKDRKFKSGRFGVGVKITSTSARKVLRKRRLAVEGWSNHAGRLTITARLGRVRLGVVSRAIGKPGHGPQVRTHRLSIRLTAAGRRALRSKPHGKITATCVARDRRGRSARISDTARLGA